jgi:hypothetical protein
LNRFDEAIKDLELLIKNFPDNKDLPEKLKRAKVERKRKRFLESIISDRSEDR